MHFETTLRIIAFPADVLGQFSALLDAYGADLPEAPARADSPTIRTLAGGRDQTDGPLILRALHLGTTAQPTPLSDGRLAFPGYWTIAAATALANGDIDGAEEITPEQFAALIPPPSEDI